MLVYYELLDISGTSNTYLVTNPSLELKGDVQDLLLHECLVSQVAELYNNHLNLNQYLERIIPNIENGYMVVMLKQYTNNTEKYMVELKELAGKNADDPESNDGKKENKSLSWKKDLSYGRSIETMSGYLLNYFTPAQNLATKLGYKKVAQDIDHLYSFTKQLHEAITQISLTVVKNKFINQLF